MNLMGFEKKKYFIMFILIFIIYIFWLNSSASVKKYDIKA